MTQFHPGGDSWRPASGWPGGAAGQAPEPPLVQIGDITVSAHWLVTPAGARPIAETTWTVTDLSRTYRAIPTWAIALAVIGFFFLFLGLLFLLIKEDRTDGWVQVTVSAPGFVHTTGVPVSRRDQVLDVHNRVHYARTVAVHAQSR